jgi:hypothetical protein
MFKVKKLNGYEKGSRFKVQGSGFRVLKALSFEF